MNDSYAIAADFLKDVNKLRRSSPMWYQWKGTVGGKAVLLKACGTWNQVLQVDGVKHGGAMDLKVSEWKAEIAEALR